MCCAGSDSLDTFKEHSHIVSTSSSCVKTVSCCATGIKKCQVDEQMLNVQNKNSSYFVEWIPNNIKARSMRFVSLCCVTKQAENRTGIAYHDAILRMTLQKVCSLIHILKGIEQLQFLQRFLLDPLDQPKN